MEKAHNPKIMRPGVRKSALAFAGDNAVPGGVDRVDRDPLCRSAIHLRSEDDGGDRNAKGNNGLPTEIERTHRSTSFLGAFEGPGINIR